MTADRQKQEILEHIAKDELAALTRDLVDIPSPTGHEREIGEFILDWYPRHGIKTSAVEKHPDRYKVLQDTLKKVIADPAYTKALKKTKVPMELFIYGDAKVCAQYVKDITAIGELYKYLLTGKS